ncbi:hypothetical protein PoB_001075900 [Plakobranchus ocellatus]|uniref:Uncharacterized protein n=1 Tax=Plakobranchus ocellatus TaxID=259542 RepID=A0AAV3YMM0_9GAST|nr:hypothetical protein PoB_001075900 [Plakobranchus ocellatus]
MCILPAHSKVISGFQASNLGIGSGARTRDTEFAADTRAGFVANISPKLTLHLNSIILSPIVLVFKALICCIQYLRNRYDMKSELLKSLTHV